MKSKLIIPAFFFILFGSSCKKDIAPGIAGKWLNTAVYSDPSRGGTGWINEFKFPQRLTLEYNARFYSFTDIPEGSGTYQFNRASSELRLNYEADQYGSPAGSFVHEVEYLDTDRMVTVTVHPDGSIFKKEYTRLED